MTTATYILLILGILGSLVGGGWLMGRRSGAAAGDAAGVKRTEKTLEVEHGIAQKQINTVEETEVSNTTAATKAKDPQSAVAALLNSDRRKT